MRDVEAGALLVAPASALPVAEQIDDRLRDIIDAYRHALDAVFFNTFVEHLAAEAHDLKRRLGDGGPAIFRTDRHPYAARNGVGEFVKSERRDQAHDAPWHELGGFGKSMVGVPAGIRELIESAAGLKDQALLAHARKRRRRDPFPGEFRKARHAPPVEEGKSALLLVSGRHSWQTA